MGHSVKVRECVYPPLQPRFSSVDSTVLISKSMGMSCNGHAFCHASYFFHTFSHIFHILIDYFMNATALNVL